MGGVEGVDGNGAVGEKEVWKKRGWKCFNLVLFLGAASMACLGAFFFSFDRRNGTGFVDGADVVLFAILIGMYGSGMSIKNTFASGAAATSFGCKSPVG